MHLSPRSPCPRWARITSRLFLPNQRRRRTIRCTTRNTPPRHMIAFSSYARNVCADSRAVNRGGPPTASRKSRNRSKNGCQVSLARLIRCRLPCVRALARHRCGAIGQIHLFQERVPHPGIHSRLFRLHPLHGLASDLSRGNFRLYSNMLPPVCRFRPPANPFLSLLNRDCLRSNRIAARCRKYAWRTPR